MDTVNECKFCNGTIGSSLWKIKRHYKTEKCRKSRFELTAQLLGIDPETDNTQQRLHITTAQILAEINANIL